MKRTCLFDSILATDRSLQRTLSSMRKKHGSVEALAERVRNSMEPGVEDLMDELLIWRAAEKTIQERQVSTRSNGRPLGERKS